MLPVIHLFGKEIIMHDVALWIEYIMVPVVAILIRKRYNYSFFKSAFYGILTLAIGYFAAMASSNLENDILTHISHGEFQRYEALSSYGYWIFISPIMLFYCAMLRLDFKKITDFIAPSVCSAYAIGKVACVFRGCCEGPADPNGIFMERVGCKVFPIQLYETIIYGIVFIISLVLTYSSFSKKHVGYIMPITGILNAALKIWAEQYRTWPSEWTQNFLNSGHNYWEFFELFSLIGCVIWLIGTIICEKKGKNFFETEASNQKKAEIAGALKVAYKPAIIKKKNNKEQADHTKNEK